MVQAFIGVKLVGVAGGLFTYAERGCERFVFTDEAWLVTVDDVPWITPGGCVKGDGIVVGTDEGV